MRQTAVSTKSNQHYYLQFKQFFLYTAVVLHTVVVLLFSSHSLWTSSSLDVPTGVAQEEGHTGFFIHLPSAVRAP